MLLTLALLRLRSLKRPSIALAVPLPLPPPLKRLRLRTQTHQPRLLLLLPPTLLRLPLQMARTFRPLRATSVAQPLPSPLVVAASSSRAMTNSYEPAQMCLFLKLFEPDTLTVLLI